LGFIRPIGFRLLFVMVFWRAPTVSVKRGRDRFLPQTNNARDGLNAMAWYAQSGLRAPVDTVIPEAAKRLSGIHNRCVYSFSPHP
jgi:hypothetical protein